MDLLSLSQVLKVFQKFYFFYDETWLFLFLSLDSVLPSPLRQVKKYKDSAPYPPPPKETAQ